MTVDNDLAPSPSRLVTAWHSRGWPVVALGGVLSIVAVVLWAAPAPMMAPWDVLVLLDGGYRMLEGQVPSTDFANPVGPLVYGLTSLGMRVHGVSLTAVAWGNVPMVIVGSALTWYGTRDRMHPGWRATATIYAALLLSAVRPLGYSPTTSSYAMLYNRHGWVLFTIVVVMVAVRPRRPTDALDHMVLGAILGLLFYTKVTFALAAGVVILLGLTRSSNVSRERRSLAVVAGLSAVVILTTALFRVDAIKYLGDIGASALVQSKGRMGQIGWAIMWTSPIWMLTGAILVGLFVSARRRRESPAPVWALVATCVVIVGASLLLTAGDAAERADLVALAVLPLVVTSSLAWQRHGTTTAAMAVAVALLLIGSMGAVATQDAAALVRNVAMREYVDHPPASQRFDSASLSDFVIPDTSQWDTAYRTAHDVPAMVNDGIRMIRSHARPQDHVFVLAFGSPFNVALGLPPTEGGMLWYDVGYDIDREHHPSAEEAIGTAEWVIVPQMLPGQGCCQETVLAMHEMYDSYLKAHFRQVDGSQDWVLLERTS